MNDLMQMFDEKNNGRTRIEHAPNKHRTKSDVFLKHLFLLIRW